MSTMVILTNSWRKFEDIKRFLGEKKIEVSKYIMYGQLWVQEFPDEMEKEIRDGIEKLGGKLLRDIRYESGRVRLIYDFED